MEYKGWIIRQVDLPVHQNHWEATRHGVTLCLCSEAAAKTAVDLRIAEYNYQTKHGTLKPFDYSDPVFDGLFNEKGQLIGASNK